MLKCNLGVIQAQRKRDGVYPFLTRDIALKTGLNRNTVAGIASGKTRRFDLDLLDKLCDVLGVGIEDLLLYVPESGS